MRKATWLAGTMTAAALLGCKNQPSGGVGTTQVIEPAPAAPAPATQQNATAPTPIVQHDVVATVSGITIDRAELEKPLMEAYGFNTLMIIMQRDMAHQACAQAGLVVTQLDIDNEWKWTLDRMFADTPGEDKQKLLDQYLSQPKPRDQMSTRTEFAIVIDTNAYLRKLAEPAMKQAITDDVLHQAFDEQYGAHVRVRHIALANPQEAREIKARLDNGEDFATLARQFSRNPETRRLGGELKPFTRKTSGIAENFKEAAFNLKPGEVSDVVAADGSYHLIKLEQKIDNKVVKFDDVKDSLREDVQYEVMLEAVKAVRNRLAQQALEQMKITDPTLKVEYDRRLQARDTLIKDREKMREQMAKERAAPATKPAATDIAPPTPAIPPKTMTPPVPVTPVPVPSPAPVIGPATAPAAKVVTPASVPAAVPHAAPVAPVAPAAPAKAPATAPAMIGPAHGAAPINAQATDAPAMGTATTRPATMP